MFIADLKLLATTCNIGDLKDSPVSDRITYRIQIKQVLEELDRFQSLGIIEKVGVYPTGFKSETET